MAVNGTRLIALAYEAGDKQRLGLAPDSDKAALELLQNRGFTFYRESQEGVGALAARSILKTLAAFEGAASDIDFVVFSSAEITNDTKSEIYDALRARNCGLEHAPVIGLCMPGCVRMLAAVALARGLVAGGQARHVLVVTADRWAAEPRLDPEGLYFGGDAALSAIVAPDAAPSGLHVLGLGFSAEQGVFDPTRSRGIEALAFVSRGLRAATDRALAEAGLGRGDVDQVFTAHVREDVMRSYGRSAGFDPEKVYPGSLPHFGHCHAADPFLGLLSWAREGDPGGVRRVAILQPAPSTWSCLIGEIDGLGAGER